MFSSCSVRRFICVRHYSQPTSSRSDGSRPVTHVESTRTPGYLQYLDIMRGLETMEAMAVCVLNPIRRGSDDASASQRSRFGIRNVDDILVPIKQEVGRTAQHNES